MLATDFQTMVHRHLQTRFVTVQTILNTFTHLNAIRISHVFGSFILYYFDPTKSQLFGANQSPIKKCIVIPSQKQSNRVIDLSS
jgi:hypothetical protein